MLLCKKTRARARARGGGGGGGGEGEGDWAIGRLGRFWALIRAHLALRTYASSQGAKEHSHFQLPTGLAGAVMGLAKTGHLTAQWLGRGRHGRGRGQ